MLVYYSITSRIESNTSGRVCNLEYVGTKLAQGLKDQIVPISSMPNQENGFSPPPDFGFLKQRTDHQGNQKTDHEAPTEINGGQYPM